MRGAAWVPAAREPSADGLLRYQRATKNVTTRKTSTWGMLMDCSAMAATWWWLCGPVPADLVGNVLNCGRCLGAVDVRAVKPFMALMNGSKEAGFWRLGCGDFDR